MAASPGWASAALWMATAVLAVISVVVAASLPSGPAGPVDAAWYRWMVTAETAWLVTVAGCLDVLGGGVVMVPVAVAASVLLALRRRWQALGFWLVALVGAEVATRGLKVLFLRERPPEPLEVEATFSFPSGHAKTAAVVSLGLVLLFAAPGTRARWLVAGAVYAVVMAWSRTYLRAHWLTDVVGGLALGVTVTVLVLVGTNLVATMRRRAADR